MARLPYTTSNTSEGQSGRFSVDPRRDPNSDPARDPRTIQLDRLGSPWISGAAREARQKRSSGSKKRSSSLRSLQCKFPPIL